MWKSLSIPSTQRKVVEALNWLVLDNPLYKDVVIDESRLDSLSEDGSIEVKNVVLE